jgi:hypothetical protein
MLGKLSTTELHPQPKDSPVVLPLLLSSLWALFPIGGYKGHPTSLA